MSGSLEAELNRLARGGATYPSGMEWKSMLGAANAWAGTTGNDILGALNIKAGNAKPNWRDLGGVCNQLAATTDLSPPEALRRRAS